MRNVLISNQILKTSVIKFAETELIEIATWRRNSKMSLQLVGYSYVGTDAI